MKVLKYSEGNLAAELKNSYTEQSVVENKFHYLYLKEYLGDSGLKTKTIVVEDSYVSRDFLHDYTSYYALCFEQYPKHCKRIHFFSNSFDQDNFTSILLDPDSSNDDFWDNYLGFIVVRPISVNVIGITILKTYSNSKEYDDRNFWGIREYNIHLYGKKLKIESLAFQEQDSVVAACATTAIWSMLHKASQDFYTILKSPSEITKDADVISPDGSRLFPNKGLSILQIAQAIINAGLVSEIKPGDLLIAENYTVVSNIYLKKLVNAYSPIGIPIILVIDVPNGSGYGLHAITISGYKKSAPVKIPPKDETSYLSDNIQRLYAHDDQWGPFVRLHFIQNDQIETPWSIYIGNGLPTHVKNVIIPLYPKIRISYEDIDVITLGLDAILTLYFGDKAKADLVWDIKLRYSEEFKNLIKGEEYLDGNEKLNIVTMSLPKYLWIVSCYIEDFKIFDFTFDATDVKNNMIGVDILSYLPKTINEILNKFLEDWRSKFESIFRHPSSIAYYNFFISKTK